MKCLEENTLGSKTEVQLFCGRAGGAGKPERETFLTRFVVMKTVYSVSASVPSGPGAIVTAHCLKVSLLKTYFVFNKDL